MTALIDTPYLTATTKWAAALLIMDGGVCLIPFSAVLTFGGLTGRLAEFGPELLAWAVTLAIVGVTVLVTARAVWRGARWPSRCVVIVVAAEIVGLALGYTYLALRLPTPIRFVTERQAVRT
jgi:hypothetical protein